MKASATDKAIYLCDWLPPDFGAVGQYTIGFARERARTGVEVVLIGLSSTNNTIETESHGSGTLTIRRLPSKPYDKTNACARLFWTIRTDLRLIAHAWRHRRNAGEIRFTGSPPFLLHFLVPLNVFGRRRLTYRITDFWPECLMAEYTTVPRWLDLFGRLTCRLRRRVQHFEVLGHDQRRRLEAIGIPGERIALVRDPSPVAITGREAPLSIPPELAGYRVLLYSGNCGVAHDIETFLEGYRRHHENDSGRVALWLNAVGSGAELMEQRLRAMGLPVARSRPLPLAELSRLLVTPDAHLITLKDTFVGYVLPSKVYGCVASRRPILFVGSTASDVHSVATEALSVEGYHQVNVGNVTGVQGALEKIGTSPGRQGRAA